MSEELKPCPFCKLPAQLISGLGEPYWVECIDCGAQGAPEGTTAEAIAAWNIRPAPKADSALVEKLRNPHWGDCTCHLTMEAAADEIERLAALSDRDVVLEEAANERERAAFIGGYRAAHMVPDAYDSISAAEEAWVGYQLVTRNLKERV